LQEDFTDMQDFSGFKIAILVLLFILILRLILKGWQKVAVSRKGQRLILKGWQKVAVSRKGQRFKFLLTRSPFSHDVTWRDVRYSILVVIDSIISMIILIWVIGKLF